MPIACFVVGNYSVDSDPGLIVRPEIARKQIDAETVPVDQTPDGTSVIPETPGSEPQPVPISGTSPLKRYHGSVKLDPTRTGRDASVIADEVISHLAGLMGTNIKVTLEIEAEIPDGTPQNVVRIVTENSRTLQFEDSGFEEE